VADGSCDPVFENKVNSNASISKLSIVHNDANYPAVAVEAVEAVEGRTSLFIMSNSVAAPSSRHELNIDKRSFFWSEPHHFFDL
jgi:hypothetical protein